MEYRKARKLSVNRLKRLTGVQKKTFELMVELVKNEEKQGCLGIMVIQQFSIKLTTGINRQIKSRQGFDGLHT